jgi:hypothetical protein
MDYLLGDTAYESYINTLDVIERCANTWKKNKFRPLFGGPGYHRWIL